VVRGWRPSSDLLSGQPRATAPAIAACRAAQTPGVSNGAGKARLSRQRASHGPKLAVRNAGRLSWPRIDADGPLPGAWKRGLFWQPGHPPIARIPEASAASHTSPPSSLPQRVSAGRVSQGKAGPQAGREADRSSEPPEPTSVGGSPHDPRSGLRRGRSPPPASRTPAGQEWRHARPRGRSSLWRRPDALLRSTWLPQARSVPAASRRCDPLPQARCPGLTARRCRPGQRPSRRARRSANPPPHSSDLA
jgi:hypothetical protein